MGRRLRQRLHGRLGGDNATGSFVLNNNLNGWVLSVPATAAYGQTLTVPGKITATQALFVNPNATAPANDNVYVNQAAESYFGGLIFQRGSTSEWERR